MEGDSTRGRILAAGASSAVTPSGNGSAKKSSSSASLALPPRATTPSFPNPVTRTHSACFPVTKTPSAAGLAMIKTTEKTPPPTDMTWEDALATLHYLEKQMTVEVQSDIEKLRIRMTSSKIELVSRKSLRLYQMRKLLNTTRRLCREEEDVMADFNSVKTVIDSAPRGTIDEDDYCSTKTKCLQLGGKLTDIRRKQQRLAGQVEELQAATKELVDMSQLEEIEGYEFNMESFKKESSALPDMPRLAPTLPSYNLFNHAPYSPSSSRPPSRSGSRASMMSMDSERPYSVSPAPPSLQMVDRHRTIKVNVAVDSTDDEDLPSDAYLPTRASRPLQKKKDVVKRRATSGSEVSDTESEDCYQVFQNRMTPMQAKQKAEEDRKEAAEREARIQKEVEEQLKREEEEEAKRMEEQAKKKKEDDEKKKAIMEAKQKAAAEKAAELEAKKKAEEDKKKAEADAKRKEEQAKKKAENDAKKQKEEEAKKKKEEAAAKKKAEADAKKQKEEEAKQRKKEEEEAKRQEEEAQKKLEQEQAAAKKKEEETRAQKAQEKIKKQEEVEKKRAQEAQEKARAEDQARKEAEEMARKEAEQEQKKTLVSKTGRKEVKSPIQAAQRQQEEEFETQPTRAGRKEVKSPLRPAQKLEEEEFESPPTRTGKKEVKSPLKTSQRQAEDDSESQPAKSARKDTLSPMQAAQKKEEEVDGKRATAALRTAMQKSKSPMSPAQKEEESLYDERQQIHTKEDLFAAISDTSLKSAKKARRRSKLQPEEEYEDSEEEVPAKKQSYRPRTMSREKPKTPEEVKMELSEPKAPSRPTTRPKSGVQAEAETMDTTDSRPTRARAGERPKSGAKTPQEPMETEDSVPARPVSRERPKTLQIPEEEPLTKTSAKSRTASRERRSLQMMEDSSSFEVDEPSIKTVKSRTASRERPKSLRVMEEHSSLESDEPPPARGAKSRTTSKERPKNAQAQTQPPERGARSRTSSKDTADLVAQSKPRTLLSRQPSGNQDSRPPSRFSDFMSDNLDAELTWDEEDDEHMPSLMPMPGLSGVKSRSSSGERPGSKTSAQTRSRPGSRDIPDLEHSSVLDNMPRPGSRTLAQEEEILKLSAEREARVARSRTSSTNRGDQRPKSRERPRELYPDFEDSEFEREEQSLPARGAKARTSSRERAPYGQRSGAALSDDQRSQPLWPEEEDEMNQQRTRSRTSSTDRNRLVGGGRDELLAEDMGLSPIPAGPSPGGYRNYREEMELDTRQYNYATDTREEGMPDDFEDAQDRFEDEDEPPPTEPIFNQDGQPYPRQPISGRPSSRGAIPDFDAEALSIGQALARSPLADRLRAEEASRQQEIQRRSLSRGERPTSRGERPTSRGDGPASRGDMDSPVEKFQATRSRTSSRHQEPEEEFYPAEESLSQASSSRGRPTIRQTKLPKSQVADNKFEDVPAFEAQDMKKTYDYGEEQYASEIDHDDDKDTSYSKSGKKVSFAESEQKFHMRPDPDVKTIPGTKLFAFSPSSTHEQPPDVPMPIPKVKERDPNQPMPSSQEPEEPHERSTSPRSFLKAMAKGVKGQPKPREERGDSLVDKMLKRGRSSSAQGSRSSSRQSSLDRAFSKPGGSSRSDASAGSGDNYDDMSETGSDFSFFRKKKKHKQIQNVDFDELFARGHALSRQMELGQEPPNGNAMHYRDPTLTTPTTSAQTTSFETYSKEEAFRKSQKGAGIGYAEKVQSFLTDQALPLGAPFEQGEAPNQQFQAPTADQADYSMSTLERRAAQEPQDPRITQSTHHRNLAVEHASVAPPIDNERKLADSAAAARRNSFISVEQGIPKLKSVSPAPSSLRSKRQMTPQEFLHKIQDFVKKAEMDAQFAQPVWPAVVKSPNELPTTRAEPENYVQIDEPKTTQSIITKTLVANPTIQLTQENQMKSQETPISSLERPMTSVKSPMSSLQSAIPPPRERKSLQAPEAPPRQRSPGRGYGPKPREHSPFLPEGPSYFESALRNPISKLPPEEEPEEVVQEPVRKTSRIAPSHGKSYLDKPSTSPDPFARSIEMDAPPSVNEAAAATSSIIRDLKKQAAAQNKYATAAGGDVDDVILLDLRKNQEKLEYLSVPSDYSHKDDVQTRGRSPHKAHTLPRAMVPADRHIPAMLTPDPLQAHEPFNPPPILQPVAAQPTEYGYGTDEAPTLQDTDLYKRLRVGLDKLMETDKFKSMASSRADISMDSQSYSHHLGRAEFGDLRRRTTSFQGINPTIAGRGPYTSQPQSRDSSNERPASAMANMGGDRGGRRSQYQSRDSSLGRHESRMSSNSNIPDLEIQDYDHTQKSATLGATPREANEPRRARVRTLSETAKPVPPEVEQKKKEVLEALAVQFKAIKRGQSLGY